MGGVCFRLLLRGVEGRAGTSADRGVGALRDCGENSGQPVDDSHAASPDSVTVALRPADTNGLADAGISERNAGQ